MNAKLVSVKDTKSIGNVDVAINSKTANLPKYSFTQLANQYRKPLDITMDVSYLMPYLNMDILNQWIKGKITKIPLRIFHFNDGDLNVPMVELYFYKGPN